jgi:hypothetical protein
VVKMLLGAIDPSYDTQDEKWLVRREYQNQYYQNQNQYQNYY